MGWIRRLRALPLRTKLIITVAGAAVMIFGIVAFVTFRYWRSESVAAAEQQALLAAASVRSAVEAGLRSNQPARARDALRELVELESITGARVYGVDGSVLVSTLEVEEGRRPTGVWIPSPRDLPPRGTARATPAGDEVNAFLPLTAGGAAVLEVDFSLGPLESAMDRAARLGLLLLVGSVAASILIVATMLEREVVSPIERVAATLEARGGRRADEVSRIRDSVADLLRKEEEAERRLADQAGFAQVGEMAAEMAHEFKRPLASIRSAVSLLEQEYELNEQAQALLGAVDDQLGRLTETMQDLFALAKPVAMEAEPVDLADTLDGALSQLAGLVDTKGRKVERRYAPDLPTVYGDRHRLEQAVLNVMLNAMEAMEPGESPGGGARLTISAERRGRAAVLEFRDTGPGIPEDQVQKVLLPFYSTKPAGTGLGLPLVARVVAAHGGTLDIESRAGEGTMVRITLPERTPPPAAIPEADHGERQDPDRRG